MELRRLRYFIAVAEEMSFTRASERLHLAQPPLSRQVRALEEELGVVLLDRTSRSMHLTKAGRILLQEGRLLLAQADAAVERARGAAHQGTACVRVGFASGLGGPMQAAIVEHLKLHPEAEVHYKSLLSSEHRTALREHRIDIGLVRPPVDDPELEGEPLFEEQLVALVPRRHRLARKRCVTLQQLGRETILLHRRGASAGIYDKIVDLIREADIHPKVVQTKTGPYEEAGVLLVAGGKGIYIAGGFAIPHSGLIREVRSVSLAEPNAKIPIWMAWRKDESAQGTRLFMQSMRIALKSHCATR